MRLPRISSLRTRLILASILVETVMLTLLVGNSLRLMQDRLLEQAQLRVDELQTLLNAALAAPLAQRDYATLADLLEQSRRDQGIVYLALVDGVTGKIVSAAGWDRTRPLPEAQRQLAIDTAMPRERFDLAVPIRIAGQTLGLLHYGLSTEFLTRARAHLLQQSVLIAAAEITLSIVLLTLLGLWLTRDLASLSAATRAVTDGNFNVRVTPRSGDEVGQLAQAFNTMAAQVQGDREQLRQMNAELERRVQARTAELENANRELEAFSYSVSHDLRAPLRAIDGFARALSEDCGTCLDATGQDYLARVRHGAQRMGMLIDDLLELSRVSRAALGPAMVDVTALAREITARLASSEPARVVTVEIAPALTAWADPRLLEIALTNLLENAWKYTVRTAQARIEVGARTQDGESVFYVRDNGAGFDMQYAGKLFGAFQRLHRADEFPGIGIGLATVARIVHRHGGRVWAEARPGEGASFYFTLGPAAASGRTADDTLGRTARGGSGPGGQPVGRANELTEAKP
jgi:signal transduction histidine kinase